MTPDATSLFWVEEPAWMSETDYLIKNALWSYSLNIFAVQYAFDITGLAKTHLLFQPLGVNAGDVETMEALAYPALSDLYYMLDVVTATVNAAVAQIGFSVNGS